MVSTRPGHTLGISHGGGNRWTVPPPRSRHGRGAIVPWGSPTEFGKHRAVVTRQTVADRCGEAAVVSVSMLIIGVRHARLHRCHRVVRAGHVAMCAATCRHTPAHPKGDRNRYGYAALWCVRRRT